MHVDSYRPMFGIRTCSELLAHAVRRRPLVVVILLGPPGVGKGTQGALLGEATGARHVATGDLLRAASRERTELGRRAQEFMDRGELVPDPLIIDLVSEVMDRLEPDTGIVFDGFPRTVPQAEALDGALAAVGRQVNRVVLLEAEEELLVKRMGGRRSCASCGAVYNVHFNPPSREGFCDRCGGALVHRPDDNPATIRRRLGAYRREAAPLVEYYERVGGPDRRTLERVAADRPVDEVQEGLRGALGT